MRYRDRGFPTEHLSRTEVHQGWTPGELQDSGRQAPPERARPASRATSPKLLSIVPAQAGSLSSRYSFIACRPLDGGRRWVRWSTAVRRAGYPATLGWPRQPGFASLMVSSGVIRRVCETRVGGRRHRGHVGGGSGSPRDLVAGTPGKAAWLVPEVAPGGDGTWLCWECRVAAAGRVLRCPCRRRRRRLRPCRSRRTAGRRPSGGGEVTRANNKLMSLSARPQWEIR